MTPAELKAKLHELINTSANPDLLEYVLNLLMQDQQPGTYKLTEDQLPVLEEGLRSYDLNKGFDQENLQSKKKDFWLELSDEDREEIRLGTEELERGEGIDYEEFMAKHRKK